MGIAIVAGVFTLAGVILGTALEWLRGNADRRRADGREPADLIAQLRDAVGTFRGFGGILHDWSEAVAPGDAPQWGLLKAALETTSPPMDAITALTRRIAVTGGGRYEAAAARVRRGMEALPPHILKPGPGYGERDGELAAALDVLYLVFPPRHARPRHCDRSVRRATHPRRHQRHRTTARRRRRCVP